MTFKEKIDKILENNTLGISSVHGLEKHLSLGVGAITKKYSKNEAPGPEVIKKIKDGLRINNKWWDNNEGDIFIDQPDSESKIPEIYRNLLEAKTEYTLIPRRVLQEEYRIVLKSEIDSKEKLLYEVIDAKNNLIEQLKKEIMEREMQLRMQTKKA